MPFSFGIADIRTVYSAEKKNFMRQKWAMYLFQGDHLSNISNWLTKSVNGSRQINWHSLLIP